MIKRFGLLVLLLSVFASCVPKKKLLYFQDIAQLKNDDKLAYDPKLQSDDLLIIIVSTPDPEASAPYNLTAFSGNITNNTEAASGGVRYQTYLIDSAGNIDFPVLGTLKLGGLTRREATEKIKAELAKYIKSAVVTLRLVNFKYSVMGEVARPGVFPVQTERVTLIEAISSAGDLTIYGDRKNILIIREVDGVKTHNFVDLTSTDFINSPYYYLDQNDIVYVGLNKTKINSSAVGPNITVGISAISLLITVIALATR